MKTPAQAEALCFVAYKFHLRVYMPCGCTRVFRPIPNHDPAIRAHGSYYVWILRLVSRLVHFVLMVDLLHDVKLHFHRRCLVRASTAVSTDLLSLLIIFCGIRSDWFWELYVSYLQVVLSLARCVCANEKSVRRVILIGNAAGVSGRPEVHEGRRTYSCLSGSHCVVSVGHSRAVLSIKS